MKRKQLTMLFLLSLILVLALSAASATAQTSSALWFVSYYNNKDLEGTPVHHGSEGSIDHDWGNKSPAPGVNADDWSARWTTFLDLDPGTYRFTVTSDDGVGVFFGDKHIISDWNKQPETTNVATVSLKGGHYPMAVDFFDDVGRALLRVRWERTGAPVAGAADVTIVGSGVTQPPVSSGAWQASYWNNTSLSGSPVLVRNEASVNYDWGAGSPSSAVNVDNWSARWTTNLSLIPGRYRFTLISDDGARLWLNNGLVIDRWFDHSAQTYTTEIDWPGGTLPVRLDYYEHTHFAQARLSWTRLGAAPDTGGGGQPIASVTAYWLNVRTGPGVAYNVIDTIPRNTTLTLIARNDDASWVQATLPDGRLGWVSAHYIATTFPLSDLPVG
jgi:hypothetical protein